MRRGIGPAAEDHGPGNRFGIAGHSPAMPFFLWHGPIAGDKRLPVHQEDPACADLLGPVHVSAKIISINIEISIDKRLSPAL